MPDERLHVFQARRFAGAIVLLAHVTAIRLRPSGGETTTKRRGR